MIKYQWSILMGLISLSLSVCASEVREQPCIDVHAAHDYEGNTPLHKACSSGNIELVRALLARGAYVNSTNKSGDTPLHRAVENKHTDVALELLARNDVNVNCYNQYRDTPLHRATFHGLIPVIERLLAKGADINARGSHDDTPLHITVENGYLDIFTKLLSYAGIDVNVANVYGDTPLHRSASLFRRHEFIPLLLEHGAQVNLVNGLNRTPLFCAVLNGMAKSVASLSHVIGVDPNIAGILKGEKVDYLGNSHDVVIAPLCLAFKQGCGGWSTQIVADLLSIPGIDRRKRCSRGRTPLIYAMICDYDASLPHTFIFRFHYDAIKLLLQDKDIDVNAMDEDKCTALHYAVLSDWAVYTVPLLASCPLLSFDAYPDSFHSDWDARYCNRRALEFAQYDYFHIYYPHELEPDITIETQCIIDKWLHEGLVEPPEKYTMRQRIEAIALALHPRLGENSPASCLDGFVLRDIAQLLKEDVLINRERSKEIMRVVKKRAVLEMLRILIRRDYFKHNRT